MSPRLHILILCFASFGIALFGVLMVYDTTSAEMLEKGHFLIMQSVAYKQFLYLFLGLLAAVAVNYVGFDMLYEKSTAVMIAITLLLVLVFIPFIGQRINGAARWIDIMGFSLQPSEFAKVFLPIALIKWLDENDNPELLPFVKMIGVLLLPVGLILLEPDNGTTFLLVSIICILFFVTKVNVQYWMIPLLMFSVVVVVVIYNLPYARQRLTSFVNPSKDLQGKGHQPYQAKIAAGSGGLLGKGLGRSMQKLSYLPKARSDYIAAIYAEEFGFVGVVALISSYLLIGMMGVAMAFRATTQPRRRVSFILSVTFMLQVFLNLAIVSNLLPSKGTSLPLFSHGGSSLIAHMLMLGVLISTSKTSLRPKEI